MRSPRPSLVTNSIRNLMTSFAFQGIAPQGVTYVFGQICYLCIKVAPTGSGSGSASGSGFGFGSGSGSASNSGSASRVESRPEPSHEPS